MPQTSAHCHAAVQNIYGAGADGFSTQNYFEVDQYYTLKLMRDRRQLAAQNRHYVFYPIWGPNTGAQAGYQEDFPYCAEEIVLRREKPGGRGTFRFRLCEHLAGASKIAADEAISGAMLVCRPKLLPGDEVEIDINGQTIPAEDIQYQWPAQQGQPPVCSFALGAPPVVYGNNTLGLRLVKNAPGARGNIVLHEVELLVKPQVQGPADDFT